MGAKPRIDRTGKGRDRMWLRFAGLAVGCAVLPGFGLAAAMTGVLAAGQPAGWWYPAAVQAHATALLMGWGVAMILGVAQHFLPRLRGVKLAHPTWVPPLFWLFAIGLVVRVCGQPLLGWCETGGHREWREPLRVAIAAGVLAQAIGVVGLVVVLAVTFRSGPPLAKNKGFQQIAPLLAVAASALCLAQVAWCVAAVRQFVSGASLAVLSPRWQWLAVDLVLFGFITAVSVAMSSRLFPLTFRTQLPLAGGLVVAAGLFAAGVVLTMLESLPATAFWWPASPAGVGALAYSAALMCGIFSVRIFHPRKPGAGMWGDPAATGVVTSYVWAAVAAAFLGLYFLQQAGMALPAQFADQNLARHATGAGFMTLLILSVGWKMLPGFGGGRPRGRGALWAAVVLANAATLLRILPILAPTSSGEWMLSCAGGAGCAAILLFAGALWSSRRSGAGDVSGQPPNSPR